MDSLLAAARFIHYAAAIQFFGGSVFYILLIPAGLRPTLLRPTRIIELVDALLLFLSGIAWLLAEAANMGDGPQDALNPSVIGSVLTHADIAHMVGATRQWVTISLKRLHDKNVLIVRKSKIIVRRIDVLREMRGQEG